MDTDTDMTPEVLQGASARFALLAYLLREERSVDEWAEVRDACAAANAAGDSDEATEACRELLAAATACVEADGLEAAYRHTFGHIPAGHFSPYESSYGSTNAFTQAHILADLNGFYHAFGVEPSGVYRERHDHMSLQCEFVALLLYKEAVALSEGNADGADICRTARRRFFEEHLGRWGGVVFDRLKRQAPAELYRVCGRAGAEILASAVAAVSARCLTDDCGVPPGPGIAEDYCPELFGCPGTIDAQPLEC